jgi:hypothetical protein
MHGHPTVQVASVNSDRCPDGVYGRIIAWLNAAGKARSRHPARWERSPPIPGSPLDVPMPHCCADQPHGAQRSLISRAPRRKPLCSALLCSAILPTGIRLPGEPATTAHGCGDRPRCARRSSELDRPLALVTSRLRQAPQGATGRNGQSYGGKHAPRKAPTSWPALGQRDPFADAPTCDRALPGAVPDERPSRTRLHHNDPAATRCARNTSTATASLVRWSRSTPVAPETLAGTRHLVDTAGGNGGA